MDQWVQRLHFSQSVLPYLLSRWTPYLHATKTQSNMISQYYWGYKQTTNSNQKVSDTTLLFLAL